MDESPHTTAHRAQPDENGANSPLYREPGLLRYLGLLWENRRLVLGGSLLPALLVAGLLALCPRRYTATFVYERPLSENEYGVFQRRFRSQENLDKMIGRLQDQGLTRYVQKLEQARTQQAFDGLIRFEVTPMYPKRLQTTDPCTSEKISSFRAKLLSVKIFGHSPEEVAGVSNVVTGNIECILPLYDVRTYLKKSLQDLRSNADRIEEEQFTLTMDLGKEQAKLEKLQALAAAGPEPAGENVVLQLGGSEKGRDLPQWFYYPTRITPAKLAELQEALSGTQQYAPSDFLPLSYQVRAVQSKIVDLQETLSSNKERHEFYLQAMDLDNQLLAKIEESLLTYYTAEQYLQFLREQLRTCQAEALCDHLRSCIRNTENLALLNTRAGERPIVYPMSRGAVKYGALTLLLGLMITSFAAVVREHRRALRRSLALGPSGAQPVSRASGPPVEGGAGPAPPPEGLPRTATGHPSGTVTPDQSPG
jgi:hypothetical protein